MKKSFMTYRSGCFKFYMLANRKKYVFVSNVHSKSPNAPHRILFLFVYSMRKYEVLVVGLI